jgi:molecular chaperone GrpE
MTSDESVKKSTPDSEAASNGNNTPNKQTDNVPSEAASNGNDTPNKQTDNVPMPEDSLAESTDTPQAEPISDSSTTEALLESIAANDTLARKDTPSIEELTRQLADAQQKAEQHWENLLRKQAEYDNLQKRMARDLEKAHKYALEKFATELLAVKDSMELGIEVAAKPETELKVVHDGMALTLKMLIDTLAKFGIVEINPQDEKFDPQWHEAMVMQTVPDVKEGMILHVHQKGYQLNDRLLRPARVVVAKAAPPLENDS